LIVIGPFSLTRIIFTFAGFYVSHPLGNYITSLFASTYGDRDFLEISIAFRFGATYRHALRLKPDWPAAANDLAWLLSTHRDPEVRNAKKAVQLAERVAQSLGERVPQILDTLAAAYASAGQFEKAVQTAERAIRLATETNQQDVAEQIGQRLRSYKARTPYYEPPASASLK
jgi:tetratricopeptide (TPR) repeat protein